MKRLESPAGIRTVLRNLFRIEDGYQPNKLSEGPAITVLDAAAGQVVFAFADSTTCTFSDDPMNVNWRYRCASTNMPFDMRLWDPNVATFGSGATEDGTGGSYLPRGWFWKLDFIYVQTGGTDTWSIQAYYVNDNVALGPNNDLSWLTVPAASGYTNLNNGTMRDGMMQFAGLAGRWGLEIDRNGSTDSLANFYARATGVPFGSQVTPVGR